METIEYSFNVQYAKDYGVNEAIMIRHFQFWIQKNFANKRHFYEGRTWTYNSQKAFEQIYPFWGRQSIRTILKSLINQGVIITSNFNNSQYDRTLWYAFQDEAKFLQSLIGENQPIEIAELTNRNGETNQPIPVVLPDIKKEINKERSNAERPFTLSAVCEFQYKELRLIWQNGNKKRAIDRLKSLRASPELFDLMKKKLDLQVQAYNKFISLSEQERRHVPFVKRPKDLEGWINCRCWEDEIDDGSARKEAYERELDERIRQTMEEARKRQEARGDKH